MRASRLPFGWSLGAPSASAMAGVERGASSSQSSWMAAAAARAYGPRGASGDAFTPDAADGYPVAETGPSWREIIAVGTPRAGRAPYTSTGVYPGGQSENPLSPWDETWIADWWNGRSHPLPPPAAGSTFSAPYATWSLRP